MRSRGVRRVLPGSPSYQEAILAALWRALVILQGRQMRKVASLHPRPSVHGEEPYPTRGDPVYVEHSGSKGVNLEKQSPILWCECRAYGSNGSG
jgi:hypothetical protein